MMSSAAVTNAVDERGRRRPPAARRMLIDEMTNIAVADSATVDSISLSFGPTSVIATTRRTQASASYGQPLQIEGVSFTVTKRPPVGVTVMQVVAKEDAAAEALGGFAANP